MGNLNAKTVSSLYYSGKNELKKNRKRQQNFNISLKTVP